MISSTSNSSLDLKNLVLARELVAQYIIKNLRSLEPENEDIFMLLDGGDGYHSDPLPGATLEDIRRNLFGVIYCASKLPLFSVSTRNRRQRLVRVAYQRQEILLLAQVADALVCADLDHLANVNQGLLETENKAANGKNRRVTMGSKP